jgi:hypothetical protein
MWQRRFWYVSLFCDKKNRWMALANQLLQTHSRSRVALPSAPGATVKVTVTYAPMDIDGVHHRLLVGHIQSFAKGNPHASQNLFQPSHPLIPHPSA